MIVESVRPPAAAGSFYPADAVELAKMVDGFLACATVDAIADVTAIVAPHAGFVYCGPVAAYSYALLEGRRPDRVVVIAPSHYEEFDFTSVFDGDAYETPLGRIPVDRAFAANLAEADPTIERSPRGHMPAREHAIEVQLPFLQRVLGNFKLVAVVMGDQGYDESRALGLALARLIPGNGDTLIVASSDLSHYHPYDQAVNIDHKTLNAIEEFDYFNLSRNLDEGVQEACGGGPIVAAMIASERLGANRAKLLDYANSGDTSGDRSRVVGYGALAMFKQVKEQAEAEFTLSKVEQDELLSIARQSVHAAVREKRLLQPPDPRCASLARERGAFVTLCRGGRLRGCIGFIAPDQPLYLTVRDAAALAALRDPRFSPVAAAEVPELEYEISVLSPLRRVFDAQAIHAGSHGILIRKGAAEGLLLPQVAAERNWDVLTFLEQTCIKAGLSPHAWRDAGADIFVFTALVFGERSGPSGALQESLEIGMPA